MDNEKIKNIVKDASDAGKKTLSEPVAKEILRLSSISVPIFCVVQDMEDAVKNAEEIGYPVVLKIISPDIVHKSDMHGVSVGIKNSGELEEKMSFMILAVADESPTACIEGFIIEKMAPNGVEVIVGVVKDEQFGPVVMFGLGGAAVELMKDVAFRLAPVDKNEAVEMMREVKGYPLLAGFRGSSAKDIEAVADVIVKLAGMISETDGIKEFEINPLIVHEHGVVAVDARAVLESPGQIKAA
ncbi:MAG: acetate--CoA ligase family protein [Deltaproteobacteria bacterium]|nr:acetate--CoA ligase family protein [Deltaproteobacteria bacterium]